MYRWQWFYTTCIRTRLRGSECRCARRLTEFLIGRRGAVADGQKKLGPSLQSDVAFVSQGANDDVNEAMLF